MSPPRPLVLGCVSLGVLLATGCTPGDSGSTPAATVTGTAMATGTVSTSVSPETPPDTTVPDAMTLTTIPMAQCDTSDLGISIAGQQGAAGSVILDLEVRLSGPRPCSLEGFPGISLIDADGAQIGAAAGREGPAAEPMVLGIGGQATTAVRIARAENYDAGSCGPVPAAALRVYPPGNTAAVDLPLDPLSGCSADGVQLLSVKALTVTPIP